MAYKEHASDINKREDYDDLDPAEIMDSVTDDEWIALARDAYRASTDYMDSSLRKQWERNLSYFRSKHPSGSKYNSDSYKYRSKNFRPKTRSAITRNEAQAAVAFFSTGDIVSTEAQDSSNEMQRLGAEINGELLNYRLTETIPWFQTCIGAFQDSMVVGACVSKQYWDFEEVDTEELEPILDPSTGQPVIDESGSLGFQTKKRIIKDRPQVDLLPIENVRFDPAADWRDVVGTSPYWITITPMYVGDVKAKMSRGDDKTKQGKWRQYDEGIINSASKQEYDSVRQSRLGNSRQDPQDRNGRTGDFRLVWVHENIVRRGNQDWIYWTLGTEHILTDPVPLEEVYPHGRPYVMGYSIIETHKTVPSGSPEIWEGMQSEINDISNQRLDNVRLVLNTRYFVKRDGNVDTRSLTRSVPGGVVMVEDMDDVRADRPADVTSSSYQEQDRLNVDFDEIAGTFSPGSIQTNRNLNETVGGMQMLTQDSNALTEYRLRIFSETWVEPVLRQLIKLEQTYETDPVVLTVAGKKAHVFDQIVSAEQMYALIEQPVTTRVNVGFGNTNPTQRIEKLGMGLNAVSNAMMVPGVNVEEVRKEIFGALGYKDGDRFFNEEGGDPEKDQLMQQVQELQAKLNSKEAEVQGRIQVAQINAEAKLQDTQIKVQSNQQIEMFKAKLLETDRQLQAAGLKMNNEVEVGKLLNQREALLFQMKIKQKELLSQNQSGSLSQTIMNDRYGAIPGQVG